MLMSHANDLKSTLMEQGLKLEKIDIQFDQFFDQSLSQQRQESNKTAGRRQRKSEFSPNQDPEDSREDNIVERVGISEGILDLVA
jgi:flagellar hook-length control protein FliK